MATAGIGDLGRTDGAVTVQAGAQVPQSESGAAAVVLLAVVLVVVLAGTAVVAGAGAMAARVAAQHAADIAALEAAHVARDAVALSRDPSEACEAAAAAARVNSAAVARCVVRGAAVTLDVTLDRGPHSATARAVAGPAHRPGG